MPYDPNDLSGLPDRVKRGLSEKKQRQWAHVWNSVYGDLSDEGRAFAAANSVTGLGKTFEHKALPLQKLAPSWLVKDLDGAGQQGWELVNICGNTAIFKRAITVTQPLLKGSDEHTLAPPAGARPTLDADVGNTCQETVIDGESVAPELAPLNFWGIVPDSRNGEKRLEAKSAMASGIESSEHCHKCVLVVDEEHNVLRGVTDFYENHAHFISKIGATDETEGHTHSYLLLEQTPVHGDTPYASE